MKNGNLRLPFCCLSGVIRILAVAVDVQTFAFLLFRNTQTDGHVSQFVADKGHNGRPDNGDGDTFQLSDRVYMFVYAITCNNTFQLYQHLVNHGDAFCVTHSTQ